GFVALMRTTVETVATSKRRQASPRCCFTAATSRRPEVCSETLMAKLSPVASSSPRRSNDLEYRSVGEAEQSQSLGSHPPPNRTGLYRRRAIGACQSWKQTQGRGSSPGKRLTRSATKPQPLRNARRKRRLIKGPREFRDVRGDQPKKTG